MVANRSAPPGPIVPTLIYADVAGAVAWLSAAFGFRERLRWGSADSFTAELEVGSGSMFVSGPHVGHESNTGVAFVPPRANELSHSLMVQVDDVDRHHDRAKAKGAVIVGDLATYPFGERQYSVHDLEGHLWTFTQSVSDVDPVDWGATVAGTDER